MTFAEQTLRLLDQAQEVEVATARPDGALRRTTIWVVVEGGEVFIRSFRGDRALWYQAALDVPEQVALIVDGRHVPVRALPAVDEQSIERCSRGLELKYRGDRAVPQMVGANALRTTLRLEPRS